MLNLKIPPIENWDIMSVIYSLVASVLFIGLLWWFGLFKKILNFFKNKSAVKKYKKQIIEDCNSLIVVGKRKGFSLQDVYIPLDIALSDIALTTIENKRRPDTYILLGGPGAGKSTTAKSEILDHLENDFNKTIPFFIRLKDYYGDQSIFQYIVSKVDKFGFTNSNEFTKRNIENQHSLCILDGLDEVRPNLREKVCNEINLFYQNYFKNYGSLIVTCRKEAYRDLPLDIKHIYEVRPLSDEQIKRFALKWPLEWPKGKTNETFFRDLTNSLRILELARSPLLLVGGLMHYTEANLGIPDERYEYLQTMAKWLVTDWANAQGHVPDIYRNVYDRLLTSLSFHMHKSNISEIPFDKACEFVKKLLPNFGYRENEAEKILNSITIKTGILIKDGSNLFFAQFGLQEFYTSIEISNQINANNISTLTPVSWWRESILLFTAQIKDPTDIVLSLFKFDPLLAVAAVAECPTPSIDIQNKSIEICLTNIDKKNQAIKGSLVPLLRKVKDEFIELEFLGELEIRLMQRDEEISSIVGISLAISGTNAATSILARHPELWNICLGEAGYLSSNFENLLVEWIQNSNDKDSFKAADLLSNRITTDRILQLMKIIPSLNKKKKEYLSRLILKEISNNTLQKQNENYSEISIISQLIPNITNPKTFIKELSINNKNQTNAHSFKSNLTSTIIIGFFFEKKGKRCNSNEILDFFSNGIFWHKNKKAIMFWLISACYFLNLNMKNDFLKIFFFFSFTFFYFIVYILPQGIYRYFPDRRRLSFFSSISVSYILFYFLGGFSLLYILDLNKLIDFENATKVCFFGSSLILSIFGFLTNDINEYNKFDFNNDSKNGSIKIPFGFKNKINFNKYFMLLIVLYGISDYFSFNPYNIIKNISFFLGILYASWLCYNAFRLTIYSKKIRATEDKVNQELENDIF